MTPKERCRAPVRDDIKCAARAAWCIIEMVIADIAGPAMQIESNDTRVSGWRGWVALFGFFLGLCSLFALVVTIGESWYEYAQSKWVVTTARIQQCQLEDLQDRDESSVGISCRIGFAVNGDEMVAQVWSRSMRPDQDGYIQDWLEAHPDGSAITARYNPANPKKVALVTTDARLWGPHTPENLRLLGLFAAASLMTIAIARVRAR